MSGRSASTSTPSLGLSELREWLETLGLSLVPEEDTPVKEQLRDGVLLCQLVNKLRPGSVETIKVKRSSGNAEENVLRFLQACTTLGVKRIFRPIDLLDVSKDFNTVLVTLSFLYNIASDMGLGLSLCRKPQTNGSSVGEGSSGEEDIDEEVVNDVVQGEEVVRAVYSFSGSNEDELQFEKGDLITVTNKVEGGWWEGVCNGKVGWFPGNYAEAFSGDPTSPQEGEEDSAHHYHNLVVKNILDTERTYVHELHTMLSVYLFPLKTANVVTSKEVDHLTGNLPELNRWQQAFFKSLEDCSKLPVPQQNIGTIFLKMSQEMEVLYTTYCANHPLAVAVLTENSDRLSTFMELKGSPSPGMLTLTSSLSKPFRRLEKYPALLKELQRHLIEGHADADNVISAIDSYNAISKRTQEIRKRKEMEHEMLSNPVKGFSGSNLNELGECACVITANQAMSAEEIEEVFYLVFPSTFVILAVGSSLSGYELKNSFPLASVSLKKGQHTEHWPWSVEILHRQETIHASLACERDMNCLVECVGRQEGVPNKVSSRAGSITAKSPGIFRSAYPTRTTRSSSVPIHREHHWGFKSLRPPAPLKTQQLLALRERDNKSPKSSKKFIYPAKKKRSSKHIDELMATAGVSKGPVENKPGDTSILRVIEAYCASGKAISNIPIRSSRLIRDSHSLLEGQMMSLATEAEGLRAELLQERVARVEFESRVQYLMEKLTPIVGSPTPP
ncbi:rho guanine nucleotide exchange factor 7-like isoform X2 [Halichondria panicea]|uniref:rho guanine nucleotide exchange factor 7-like isoform X2 n=1 Tax=Halichondria panicea TaxID=6063 RepID=UPI00312BBA50